MSNTSKQVSQLSEFSPLDGISRYVLALCLGLTLFGLYFLTYSGRLQSSDSVSIYAVTESIAKRGEFDASPFIWDRWTAGYQDAQGDFGVDGEVYSKKGLGASMAAAPLAWLALRVPGIGLMQTTYLFNMLVTALTAVVLFFYALRLGYSRDVSLLVGGLFGVATMAWPYAGYFYSEPLMGLLLLTAAYLLLLFNQQRGLIYLFGGGLAMGWGAVTRLTNLVLLPIYLAYALGPSLWDCVPSVHGTIRRDESTSQPDQKSTPTRDGHITWRTVLSYAVTLSLAVGLCLLVIAMYNYMRFQTPFRSGYAQTAGFWTPLWEGLYGLFLSPRKSLFLHAPILLLSLCSMPLFLKRHPREGVFLLALFIAPTLLFAKWMDWEGGLAWGPRYLVALVPLVMPFSAPGLAWLLGQSPLIRTRGRWTWLRHGLLLLLGVLALWSVMTQVLAASVNFVHYLRIPRSLAAQVHGSPLALSPPLRPWVFSPRIIGKDLIELAWFRLPTPETVVIVWEALIATVLFTFVALAALFWVRAHRPTRRTAVVLSVAGLLLVVLLTGFNLHHYFNEPNRGAGDDYMGLVDYLAQHEAPDDVLLVSSHMYMGFFMNYNRASMQWYSLLSKEDNPSPDEATLFEHVLSRHPRVWLAIDRIPELGLPRPAEKWLTQHAYKIDEQTFSDYSRLLLYSTANPPDAQRPQRSLNFDLGHGIRLAGYDVHSSRPLPDLGPGDDLRFSLLWEAAGIPDGDFAVFAQLLNGTDELVWQVDRRPADGFRATSTWLPGERIRDNYGLILPADWEGGEYSLVVGMYDAQTGVRLPMLDTDGVASGDYVTLVKMMYRS